MRRWPAAPPGPLPSGPAHHHRVSMMMSSIGVITSIMALLLRRDLVDERADHCQNLKNEIVHVLLLRLGCL